MVLSLSLSLCPLLLLLVLSLSLSLCPLLLLFEIHLCRYSNNLIMVRVRVITSVSCTQ